MTIKISTENLSLSSPLRGAEGMTERLLQFIWQFQYFNKGEIQSTSGETIQVIFPGTYNINQGPDFNDAKIKIGKTTWVGNVELHLRSSDWNRHNHQNDKNYNNVILHVVWEDDFPDYIMPVLKLNNRVAKIFLQRYEDLMNAQGFIPCEKTISSIKPIVWQSWKERLLAERLIRKSEIVKTYLQQNNYHWEETFWWLLARNFGIKVNADAFESVARSIPLNILSKQKNQIHHLEALLFGQAGLLEDKFEEDYPQLLQHEYEFQKSKYKLNPSPQ